MNPPLFSEIDVSAKLLVAVLLGVSLANIVLIVTMNSLFSGTGLPVAVGYLVSRTSVCSFGITLAS